MNKKSSGRGGHMTAFYIESLFMMLIVIAVCLIIVRVFGLSRANSREARHLTDAVALAQNAAELAAASDSSNALYDLLDEGSAVMEDTDDGTLLTASYDDTMAPDPSGSYTVEILWNAKGTLASVDITVLSGGEEIYTLSTAVYTAEGGAA